MCGGKVRRRKHGVRFLMQTHGKQITRRAAVIGGICVVLFVYSWFVPQTSLQL